MHIINVQLDEFSQTECSPAVQTQMKKWDTHHQDPSPSPAFFPGTALLLSTVTLPFSSMDEFCLFLSLLYK